MHYTKASIYLILFQESDLNLTHLTNLTTPLTALTNITTMVNRVNGT